MALRKYKSCDAQAITKWLKYEIIGHFTIRFVDDALCFSRIDGKTSVKIPMDVS